ncbi:hypothetical protein [Streptomyces sp. NPDC054940]
MRWLTLYARSRQVPASFAVVVTSAVAVWALARGSGAGPADPRLPTLVLAAGTMAASIGLGGQDLALDRTAAIRWAPRRAVHVLLIGTVVGAVLLAVQTLGEDLATTAFVARNCAGLTGLCAIGATICGAQHAWTLPASWLALSLFAPSPTDVPTQVMTWMMLPPGTAAGTWTALVLAVAGTAAYAVAGPRRP